MNRGQGNVYRRGNVWWLVYWHRGRRHRESSRSEHRTDAVKLLRRRMGEMGIGRLAGPDVERTTFEDLAAGLLNDYVANERPSVERVRSALTHLRPFFGLARALDITADRLTGYVLARREERAAPATIRNELALLKRAFRLAETAGRVAQRPAFPTITVKNTRTGFFERADFEAVREKLPEPLRPVVTFAYLTGWRKREILGLQWRDVDFEAGTVRLEPGTTKNTEGREFPFRDYAPLGELFDTQREATTALERATGQLVPWVFHRNGRAIRSYDVAWRAACEAAGIPGRLVHDFRRTAVRNLERAGVSRSVAMMLTGHKTESVYRRYAIVAAADLREGVAKLAALHGQKPEPRKVRPMRKAGVA